MENENIQCGSCGTSLTREEMKTAYVPNGPDDVDAVALCADGCGEKKPVAIN